MPILPLTGYYHINKLGDESIEEYRGQTATMTKIQASVISEPYKVSYIDPIYTPNRRLSVICIGAGASGLLLAYKLDRHFDTFDLTIYEKNADIGGTWFENRYPGFV
jgi:ribulose 1,5-bisphosphate synthetase/thiazole synthase